MLGGIAEVGRVEADLRVEHRLLSTQLAAVAGDRDLERALHSAIKKVTESVEQLRFNTAIAEMMVFVNEATKREKLPRPLLEKFLLLLAPFAPHLAEEVWAALGHPRSIANERWPVEPTVTGCASAK